MNKALFGLFVMGLLVYAYLGWVFAGIVYWNTFPPNGIDEPTDIIRLGYFTLNIFMWIPFAIFTILICMDANLLEGSSHKIRKLKRKKLRLERKKKLLKRKLSSESELNKLRCEVKQLKEETAERFKVCCGCGKKVSLNAKFCDGCGDEVGS